MPPYHAFWQHGERDLGRGNALNRFTATTLGAVANGVGWDFSIGSGRRGVYNDTIIPPASGWCIEAYFQYKSSASSQYIAGISNNPTTPTEFDRTISIASNGVISGWIYDGSERVSTYGTPLVNGNVYHVCLVVNATLTTLYVNAVPASGIVSANSGYTGYSSTYFVCGYGSTVSYLGGSAIQCVSTVFYANMHHRILPFSEIKFRAHNPYAFVDSVL